MATKANAQSVAKTAAQSALGRPHWEYTQKDCQAWVEWCWAQNGYKVNYAGSNDMFRNACSWVGTVDEAREQGKLVPGALVFKYREPGAEKYKLPDAYKPGGKSYNGDLRDYYHVGIYCGGIDGVEVGHSSTGGSQAGTLKGWHMVGLAKGVNYDGSDPQPDPTPSTDQVIVDTSTASKPGDPLLMRKTPGGKYERKIPNNTVIPVLGRADGWIKTKYLSDTGWVDAAYTRPYEATAKGYKLIVDSYKGAPLEAEQSSNLRDELMAAGYNVRREEV